MFKRKDKKDLIHHANIKRSITSHFARTLKVLQQRHLQKDSDEFIYSDDFSNNLCSALEAVFLHGLKDSVVSKMSNYVGLANTQDQTLINFWNICVKFTHGDVITQLRNLGQINTDVGLCRAWIRIALNDGLVESYLHSMLVDHKMLTYFYHSHSYMRDHEQPGILKNFLTGLMSLSFKLSFNSSVLNSWSNTSLQLSGILDSRNIPQPSLTSGHANSSQAENDSVTQGNDEPIIIKRKVRPNSKPDLDSHDGSPKPMFSSIQDVEAIRRHAQLRVTNIPRSATSEGSNSSHISCPDTGSIINLHSHSPNRDSGTLSVGSPALYSRLDIRPVAKNTTTDCHSNLSTSFETKMNLDYDQFSGSDNFDDKYKENKDDSRRSSSSVIVEASSPFFDLEIAQTPPRPRSRRVDDEDLKSIKSSPREPSLLSTHSSSCHSISNSPKMSEFEVYKSAPRTRQDHSTALSTKSDEIGIYDNKNTRINASDNSTNLQPEARGIEEICATLPPLKLDPLEQEAILKKVLGEIDQQADREREKREEQRQVISMSYDEVFEDSKFVKSNEKQNKTEEGNGKERERDSGVSLTGNLQVEDTDVTDFETQGKKSSASGGSGRSVDSVEKPKEREAVSIKEEDEQQEVIKEDECVDVSGSPVFGNSLSGMTGWSSQIQMQNKKDRRLREKTRGESFASMLKTYAGEHSLISTTLDQVIQTFYGDTTDSGKSPPRASGLQADTDDDSNADGIERQDSILEEFEILSPNSVSLYSIHTMDTSRSIFLFRIPREHGLSHQNFVCRGCSRPIGIIYGAPRLCGFDGGLYCYECHENNEACIPSYIVYNWDFTKRRVAIENYKFLQTLEDQALYNLDDLNPKLETHVPEIGSLKVLRQQLCFLKSYMFNCTQKVAESLRQKVWPREHLYERASVYSVNDFHQVHSGVLTRFIKDLVKFASKHVYQCNLCSQKGYVCEVCRIPQVIFPFELDTTVRCPTCKSVYHKTCLTESLPCPKCERWGKRTKENNEPQIHPEDYGVSPPF